MRPALETDGARVSRLVRRGRTVVSAWAFLLVLILTALPQSASAQLKTYGIRTGNIFEINTTTDAATSVLTLTGGTKAALGQRASDGIIYFTIGLGGNDSVFRWDPAAPAAAGIGWTCAAPVGQVVTRTQSDALASSGAHLAITLTVKVSGTAPATVTNTARVSGGGEPPGNPALTGVRAG